MLLIACPHCGPRPETEFAYGGDASARHPDDPAALSDEAWTDHVYFRDNPRGAHRELWFHAAGCGKWLIVERDTVAHSIASVRPAAEEPVPA